MLKKYLQFLTDSFEKLTTLNGNNSTWGDYFLTVGNEILVVFIGLAYLATIFLIIYIPVFGNRKILKEIRKRDKWYEFNGLYDKYVSAAVRIRVIITEIMSNYYDYSDELNNSLRKVLEMCGIKYEDSLIDGDKFDKDMLNNMLRKQFNFIEDFGVSLDDITKYKWDNCGIFSDFSSLGKYATKKSSYIAKCVLSCSTLLLVYAIFVIPLVLMLF